MSLSSSSRSPFFRLAGRIGNCRSKACCSSRVLAGPCWSRQEAICLAAVESSSAFESAGGPGGMSSAIEGHNGRATKVARERKSFTRRRSPDSANFLVHVQVLPNDGEETNLARGTSSPEMLSCRLGNSVPPHKPAICRAQRKAAAASRLVNWSDRATPRCFRKAPARLLGNVGKLYFGITRVDSRQLTVDRRNDECGTMNDELQRLR